MSICPSYPQNPDFGDFGDRWMNKQTLLVVVESLSRLKTLFMKQAKKLKSRSRSMNASARKFDLTKNSTNLEIGHF